MLMASISPHVCITDPLLKLKCREHAGSMTEFGVANRLTITSVSFMIIAVFKLYEHHKFV
jgi:hypothetical protein